MNYPTGEVVVPATVANDICSGMRFGWIGDEATKVLERAADAECWLKLNKQLLCLGDLVLGRDKAQRVGASQTRSMHDLLDMDGVKQLDQATDADVWACLHEQIGSMHREMQELVERHPEPDAIKPEPLRARVQASEVRQQLPSSARRFSTGAGPSLRLAASPLFAPTPTRAPSCTPWDRHAVQVGQIGQTPPLMAGSLTVCAPVGAATFGSPPGLSPAQHPLQPAVLGKSPTTPVRACGVQLQASRTSTLHQQWQAAGRDQHGAAAPWREGARGGNSGIVAQSAVVACPGAPASLTLAPAWQGLAASMEAVLAGAGAQLGRGGTRLAA